MKTTLSTALILLLLLTAAPAQAYDLAWDDYTYDGVTVTPYGGDLSTKNTGGIDSLGVTGGVNGEIGIGQSITFSFDTSQYLSSLSLALLFTSGNYGDVGNETAQVTVWSGDQSYTGVLTATESYEADWTGSGTVANVSLAEQGYGGLWEILNPFGMLAIDSIVLTALDSGGASTGSSANSDFGFNAMTTSATPIPGAVWLLLSGLVGLVGLRKRADV